jgi:hypothetical protein
MRKFLVTGIAVAALAYALFPTSARAQCTSSMADLTIPACAKAFACQATLRAGISKYYNGFVAQAGALLTKSEIAAMNTVPLRACVGGTKNLQP